jgi:agmatinase
MSANGGLTFYGLPMAVTPEDLTAGQVEVAILGAPLDMRGAFRGAEGPNALRASRTLVGGMEPPENWRTGLVVVDYGNTPIDQLDIEQSVLCEMELVGEIADAGAIPVIIGGDHSLEYPDVAGLADVYGRETIGVIHFDSQADADAVSDRRAYTVSRAQPVRRLVDEGWIVSKNYVQVGLQESRASPEALDWMRRRNLRYHAMVEAREDGWSAVISRALNEANEGAEHLFISFDIDVLDPAYAPDRAAPMPGGVMLRELLPFIRGLCAETNMIGFDLVDAGHAATLNSNPIIDACLTGIAMRKRGVPPDYLSTPGAGDDHR